MCERLAHALPSLDGEQSMQSVLCHNRQGQFDCKRWLLQGHKMFLHPHQVFTHICLETLCNADQFMMLILHASSEHSPPLTLFDDARGPSQMQLCSLVANTSAADSFLSMPAG